MDGRGPPPSAVRRVAELCVLAPCSLRLSVAAFVGSSLERDPRLCAPPCLAPPLRGASSPDFPPRESVKNRERHVIELGPSPWLQPGSK